MSTIHYTVSMPHPETHLFQVEVEVTGFDQTGYDFVFDDYVRGVAELPFEHYLDKVGLAVAYGWKGDEAGRGERSAGLGVRLKQENGRTVVETLLGMVAD